MNRYLIDTHVLLWACAGTDKLSQRANILISNSENYITVSLISFWEVAIKASIGKLDFRISIQELHDVSNNKDFELILPDLKTIDLINKMPFYKLNGMEHRDPFDRMLIAQAITENIPIISADTKFDLYPEVQRIW